MEYGTNGQTISYQALVFLLLSTSHHFREVHQGPSHIVTFGFFMGIFVLGLIGARIIKVSILFTYCKNFKKNYVTCVTDYNEKRHAHH